MLLITDEKKKIHFLSQCFVGKTHDYARLKSLFNPIEKDWFENHHIQVN